MNTLNIKACSKCKETKAVSEFSKTGRRDGLFSSLCRVCSVKKSSEWNKKNPENRRIHSRKNKLKKLYGITPEEYSSMALNQDGKCLICDSVRKLVVDHNHNTGSVRGLLCRQCNAGIGYFKENILVMENAIKYVTKNT